MKKSGLIGVKPLCQDHVASGWQSWGMAGPIRMTYSFHTPQEVATAAMLLGLPGASALTDLKWHE